MMASPGNADGTGAYLSDYDLNFAAANGGYFEFKLTPASGQALFIDSLLFAARRASTSSGPNWIAVRSSLDGFTSNLAAGISTAGTLSAPTNVSVNFGSALKNVTSAVTLRVYGYARGATSSSYGLWAISNHSSGKFSVMGRMAPASGGATAAALREPDVRATPSDGKVVLEWKPVAGASSYNIKVGLTRGGPYVPLASRVAETVYRDEKLTNGKSYYYVISPVSPAGEGAGYKEIAAVPGESQ